MLKALVWKEFREMLPACATALAIQVMAISYAVAQWRLSANAGDVYAIWPFLYLTAVVFPMLIGVWQNSREASQNTFQFLLQRPVGREALFGAKLAFGSVTCLIVGLAPLLCFTVWIETVVRRHDGPLLESFWVLASGVWLLYLGGFLSGLRPGRWYGSRFCPLLAGIFLFILLHVLFHQLHPDLASWSVASLALAPLLAICFVVAALYVGRTRDYS